MDGSAQQPYGAPNEQQKKPEESQEQDGDEPFNPLTNATHDTNSAIGNSVVKDLMRVYESLTQSSTPQTPQESQGGGNIQQDQSNIHSAQQQQDHSMQGYPPPHPQYSQHLPQQQQTPIAPQYPQHSQHPMPFHYPTAQHPPPPNHYYPEPHQCHQQQGAPLPGSTAPPDQQPSYGMPRQEQQMPTSERRQMDRKDGESSDENENPSEDPQEQRNSRSKAKKRGGSEVDASVNSSGPVAKKRKKGKATDGRWCKRFTWPEDLHRDFVSAIFDVGLKHSSPSTILEHMPKNDQITTERIKSHLQKYRMHRAKSKKEFATSYEHSLIKLRANGLIGVKSLSAGEVPAHLAYTAMHDGDSSSLAKSAPMGKPITSMPAMNEPLKPAPPALVRQPCDALMLPQLTEAEKASPIGASMGYLMGLFFSLKQQLMVQRSTEARAENDKIDAPDVQAVFNSFIGSIPPSAAAPAGPDMIHDATLQTQVSFDQSSTATASKTPAVLAAPSVRTNLEENNMMKREMQNQMAFQNKMRALKQQELNKYKNVNSELKEEGKERVEDVHASIPSKQADEDSNAAETDEQYQGAGETGGADPSSGTHARSRSRGMSMGGSDEFWNIDVVDDQIFEFLIDY